MAALSTTRGAAADVPHAHLDGSKAIAPRSAPPEVQAMVDAGNRIRHKPYVWGGGHRRWRSRGYDCSGSVSYVLHKAGLLDYPLDSTGFMHWGKSGHSNWVTIYSPARLHVDRGPSLGHLVHHGRRSIGAGVE
jgi:cell wall-associated NlpC family hydrolase